jgi:hypothetical protein
MLAIAKIWEPHWFLSVGLNNAQTTTHNSQMLQITVIQFKDNVKLNAITESLHGFFCTTEKDHLQVSWSLGILFCILTS